MKKWSYIQEMQNENRTDICSTQTFTIGGMHCQSCVGRVETALLRVAGVAEVTVDLAEQKAKMRFDSEKVSIANLKASVEAEGYHILDQNKESPGRKAECCGQTFSWFSNPRCYLYGLLASIAVVGAYLGMNTLTADWYFARIQLSEFRWWILTLAVGLGIQVSLFTLFRAHFRGQKIGAAKSTMAASGGMSATAMMACCSHYLATIIPVLGIPFLSATAVAGIAKYQSYFFLAGVISCLFGIGLMLRMMNKHGMIRLANLKNFLGFAPSRVGG
jgi:copper chaperone CopZ